MILLISVWSYESLRFSRRIPIYIFAKLSNTRVSRSGALDQ